MQTNNKNLGIFNLILSIYASIGAVFGIIYLLLTYDAIVFNNGINDFLLNFLNIEINFPSLLKVYFYLGISFLVVSLIDMFICKLIRKKEIKGKLFSVSNSLCNVALIVNLFGFVISIFDYIVTFIIK